MMFKSNINILSVFILLIVLPFIFLPAAAQTSFSFPQERRTLTLVGRCDFSYRDGSGMDSMADSSGTFHGRVIYMELNSAGEIVVSGCRNSSAESTCQNIFRGKVTDLCQAEIRSRQLRSSVRGGVDVFTTLGGFPFSLVAAPRGLTMAVSAATSQLSGAPESQRIRRRGTDLYYTDRPAQASGSERTQGARVAEMIVPGLGAAREVSEADCTLTKNFIEIINHDDPRSFDSGSSKENKQIAEGAGDACLTRNAMSILSTLRPEIELSRIRNSPSFQIVTENGSTRVTTTGTDPWYQNFLRQQENAEHARRRANAVSASPAPRPSASPAASRPRSAR